MSPRRVFAYSAIYLLWGVSFLAIRDVVSVTPPLFSAALRFVTAGGLLYLLARFSGAGRVTPRQWRHSALLGFIIFGGNYACLFWAEQRLDSGVAAVLTAMVPVWIYLGEWLVLHTQRLRTGPIAGAVLGISGVLLLSHSPSPAGSGHTSAAMPSAVLILGTLLFAVGSLWSRRLTLPAHQGMRAGLQMVIGGLLLAAASAAFRELPRLPAALGMWQWHTAVSMLYLIFAASILAFTAYTWLLHHEPPTRVASYAYVNPLVALWVGVGLAHEHMGARQWMGAALVLLGVLATLWGERSPAPAHAPAAASAAQ